MRPPLRASSARRASARSRGRPCCRSPLCSPPARRRSPRRSRSSRRSPSRRRGSRRRPQRRAPSSSRSSPPATTSAARWTSRSRSSTRRSSSTPTTPRIYNVYGLVYTMLGENAEGRGEFPPRAGARAGRLRDPPELGLVPVPAPGARASRSPSSRRRCATRSTGRREIALINAGKCSAVFGDVAGAQNFYRRALTVSPNNPEAAYNFALLRTRRRNYGDARALMRIVMLQTNPPPEALYLGAVHRAQARRPPVRGCRT